MSHFTVWVTIRDSEVKERDDNIMELLEEKLLPYHEYECTGIEEYTEWVTSVKEEDIPDHTQDIVENHEDFLIREGLYEEYVDNLKKENYASILKDWHGYDVNEDGDAGRITNPNYKWDWWTVGGRWDGGIKTLDGQETNVSKVKDIDREETHNPYAVVHDGEWLAKGKMGWFAVSYNEDEDKYKEDIESVFESLGPEDRIILVDCHI